MFKLLEMPWDGLAFKLNWKCNAPVKVAYDKLRFDSIKETVALDFLKQLSSEADIVTSDVNSQLQFIGCYRKDELVGVFSYFVLADGNVKLVNQANLYYVFGTSEWFSYIQKYLGSIYAGKELVYLADKQRVNSEALEKVGYKKVDKEHEIVYVYEGKTVAKFVKVLDTAQLKELDESKLKCYNVISEKNGKKFVNQLYKITL